ncbi:hypothetical protein ABZ438_16960 [Streptomyces sp. NPDC005786]|uniref:hypothetical protein n=1 Tax=unclassified Streptomyces TaxID=2593676 RepID=UPI003401AE3E
MGKQLVVAARHGDVDVIAGRAGLAVTERGHGHRVRDEATSNARRARPLRPSPGQPQ